MTVRLPKYLHAYSMILIASATSCSPRLLSPTITPTPHPTFTPTPVTAAALESYLIRPGDLPAGYAAAQIRTILPEMFDGFPKTDVQIFQELERAGERAGWVAILMYNREADLDVAYRGLLRGFGESQRGTGTAIIREVISEVGDRAEGVSLSVDILGVTLNSVDIAFVRCAALVHIRMVGASDFDPATSYAQRLDARLADAICP